ncbi:hypothetical protein [Paenibacillus thalictri]|uniref:Uncharacterized protein n=1 Tax=Paenibacillus thalictri TaxID=2527873 RepID=A0A4V2J426_9BACL|nr:hypothetical protein [Paenibacillus thalictri]TBL77423.1 hypothetical protein EYB31_18305 [Paenibacillus thalictri]
MLTTEIIIQAREIQNLYEEAFLRKQIEAGNVQAIGCCFLKDFQREKVRERKFLAPHFIDSEKQVIDYLAEMELLKTQRDEKACLIAELTDKVEGYCIDGRRFEISLAHDNGKSNEQREEYEICKPLYVLIREEGIKGAAREISDKMANERYAFTIDYMDEMDGNTELFMPFFGLAINVAGYSVEKKGSICQAVQSTFDMFDCFEVNDELRFTIQGIHGEGPCVYSIWDIISVAREQFGPEIDKRMASIGLTDYKVIFSVNEFIC